MRSNPLWLCLVTVFVLASCSSAEDSADTGTTPVEPPCSGAAECDDDNACTLDVCTATGCQNLAVALACDDGDPCTVGDLCTDGTCTAGTNICECQTADDCDDGNACNGAETCDTSSPPYVCAAGSPVECDSADPCLTSSCNEISGACETANAADGTACDDGDDCTVGDSCTAGTCSAGINVCACQTDADCDDGNACNGAETCDTSGEAPACIAGQAVVCESTDPCIESTCEPESGACVNADAPAGTACDDGDDCTVGDTCAEGTCGGVNVCECTADTDCDDGNPCNGVETCDTSGDLPACVAGIPVVCTNSAPCVDAACDSATGLCVDVNSPVGTACDDGDDCTVGDTCAEGTCAGTDVCGACNTNDDCESGACIDATCANDGGACGTVPPDGQCQSGHRLVCDAGALSVSACDPSCGGCDGCVSECALDTFGCSALGTHRWTCTDDDGCLRRHFELCALGCAPGVGCLEDVDTDGDGTPDVEDEDDDGDGVDDDLDVCPLVGDDQTDTDDDGDGDACDDDDDDDYIPDAVDNCPLVPNSGQEDADENLVGDACDDGAGPVDSDEDGVPDIADNCDDVKNADQTNSDEDSFGDACDNCPDTTNEDQADTNGNQVGDVCEGPADTDNDGVPDAADNCVDIPNPTQENSDEDAFGDACDNCPDITNPDQANGDDDAFGDQCDNCPAVSNDSQLDLNGNLVGDACEGPTDVEPPVILTNGTTDAYRLQGLVLTPTGAIVGEVLVVGETIVCVDSSCAEHVDAAGAWVIDTKGVISPGLIDTHNHILFDVFNNDDWVPTLPTVCSDVSDCVAGSSYCSNGACDCVNNQCKYTNHKDWPKEDEYGLMLDYKQCMEDASQGKPDWCPQSLDEDGDVKCEMQKWGELKGLVAGTTSIVGLPGTSSKCVGSLARSVDVSQNDLDGDKVQTSALFPPSSSSANGVCANYADGDTEAYLIHVGEGVDQDALDQFTDLFELTTVDGCLYDSKTVITHGTAFGQPEFATMAQHGMKLTWSPASNNALYGRTTDIPTARGEGLIISLAPDWSMGGSPNLLDELRFADEWDNANWDDSLSSQDLFDMVTTNAATVLGLDGVIGRIEVGHMADLVVFSPAGANGYDALLAATPDDVRLVMVGGIPLVGHPALQAAAPSAPGCETVTMCAQNRFLCVAEDTTADKLGQTLGEIETALQDAFLAIDGLVPEDDSLCGGCAADEECFLYQAKPEVDEALCPAPCGEGLTCIQAKKSGTDQHQCLPTYTCSPKKTQKQFWPVAPLVTCPAAAP